MSNLKENNGLIAEFMGFKKGNEFSNWKHKNEYSNTFFYSEDGKRQFQENSAKYNSSWDWLMPVVEKIDKLSNGTEVYGTYCIIRADNNTTISSGRVMIDKISSVYRAVVDFIKWHNAKALGETPIQTP